MFYFRNGQQNTAQPGIYTTDGMQPVISTFQRDPISRTDGNFNSFMLQGQPNPFAHTAGDLPFMPQQQMADLYQNTQNAMKNFNPQMLAAYQPKDDQQQMMFAQQVPQQIPDDFQQRLRVPIAKQPKQKVKNVQKTSRIVQKQAKPQINYHATIVQPVQPVEPQSAIVQIQKQEVDYLASISSMPSPGCFNIVRRGNLPSISFIHVHADL